MSRGEGNVGEEKLRMIKSYGAQNYQWTEIACNTAEGSGATVIAITDHGALPGFRVWVRWPGLTPEPDPVSERLFQHRSVTPQDTGTDYKRLLMALISITEEEGADGRFRATLEWDNYQDGARILGGGDIELASCYYGESPEQQFIQALQNLAEKCPGI